MSASVRTNTEQRQVRWQFIADDARVKLRHLYPKSWQRHSAS
jgi:hypothetical protein